MLEGSSSHGSRDMEKNGRIKKKGNSPPYAEANRRSLNVYYRTQKEAFDCVRVQFVAIRSGRSIANCTGTAIYVVDCRGCTLKVAAHSSELSLWAVPFGKSANNNITAATILLSSLLIEYMHLQKSLTKRMHTPPWTQRCNDKFLAVAVDV